MSDDRIRAARAVFAAEELEPHSWSNEPGFVYGAHDHPYHKVLVCTAGSITFHIGDRDVVLRPGDRLDVSPGEVHSATVGADGVTCWEASRH